MIVDIFGFEKDERIDKEWHQLVGKLESAGWQRESFTTLYESGNLFIPDAPQAEMSYDTSAFLYNVTAYLTEKKVYLGIASGIKSSVEGQLTLITYYGSDLELWLDTISGLPQEIRPESFSTPILALIQLFPDSYLEMPVDDEHVAVPVQDPITHKVLKTPWCRKGPCHEIILDEPDLERLRKMARLNASWL